MLVNHHKYKEPVALGKISNNEKCRMIVQLLQEKQKTQAQLQVASMIIAKIPEKTKKKYTDEINKESR